jgi:hypothetical protein
MINNIEQAISNAVTTVTAIDDRIVREKDEKRLNELQSTRELLIRVLRELTLSHEDISQKKTDQFTI